MKRFVMIRPFRLCLLSIGVAAAGLTMPAHAGDSVLKSSLRVSFLGIPVADLHNTVRLAGDSYRVDGSLKSNSLVSVVARTKANFSSSGRISGARLLPDRQGVDYRTRKKKGTIALAFANGNLTKASIVPLPKKKPGKVPISKNHTANVIDPVSALLVTVKPGDVGNGQSVCNRNLPVFDGTHRYNLKLSYKSTGKARAKGFSGAVHTCAVRYEPVAGHRPNKKSVRFMSRNRDMQVTLARIGATSTYGLFGFRVRTDKGVALGRAYRFASN